MGEWRRSTRCANSACVEVGGGPVVRVRGGKDREGLVLVFDAVAWQRAMNGLRGGRDVRGV